MEYPSMSLEDFLASISDRFPQIKPSMANDSNVDWSEVMGLQPMPNASDGDSFYDWRSMEVRTQAPLRALTWYTTDFKYVYTAVFEFGINSLLCLLGVINNVISISVFAKMGYKETTNISMTAIAFWDIIKHVSLTFQRGRAFIYLFGSHYRYHIATKSGYHSIRIHLIEPLTILATHASSMLAVYVAVERCLCVSMPFTVRRLLTRKTAIAACFSTSAFVFGSYSFQFLSQKITTTPMRDPRLNSERTLYSTAYTSFGNENYEQWVQGYINILNSVYPVFTVVMMSVCTVIILTHLKKSSRFRSRNAQDGSTLMSPRERKITKMLIVIIFFYIIYLVPWLTYHLVVLELLSLFIYLDEFLRPFVEFFSLMNSSVNLYIFYFMSSEFKRTLRKMFHLSAEKPKSSTDGSLAARSMSKTIESRLA